MANVPISTNQGGTVFTLGSITLTVSGANLLIAGLPTSDPAVAGALWSNSGVVTVSAG